MRISDWSSDVCSSDLCIEDLPPRKYAGTLTIIRGDIGPHAHLSQNHDRITNISEHQTGGEVKGTNPALGHEQHIGAAHNQGRTHYQPRPKLPPAAAAAIHQAPHEGIEEKEIGRAHVQTPVTNAPFVCRLPLYRKNTQ